MSRIASYFFRGLLVLLPILATIYVVALIFTKLNDLVFMPLGIKALGDEAGWPVTLVGIGMSFAIIVLVGFLASNFLGRAIVKRVEEALKKIPLIKLLYSSVKDLLSAFVGDKKSFDQPVVVSLTKDGPAKVIGFVTRTSLDFLGLDDHVSVYLPQSYNFAGNLMVFPADQIQRLDADSSDVMTFLVSGGVSGDDEDSEDSTS